MKTLQKSLRKTLTREEFIEKCYNKSGSVGSKNVTISALTNFDSFCIEEYGKKSNELLDEIKGDMSDALYTFLQDFINYMQKNNLKPNTIAVYFSAVKSFVRSQGIRINSDDIKDLVTRPTIIQELMHPLTREELKLLLDYSKPDRKTYYLTLSSSGMRIGESLSLKKSDFDMSQNPVMITIQGKFTKTKQTRQTYASSEAKEGLEKLLENKQDDELVFAKSDNLENAIINEEKIFHQLRKRCGLDKKYPNSSRHLITIHSMRAFFHTQASLVHDEQYANALDGHQGYLMQYYRLPPEKRSEMYRELEPKLLIYTDPKIVELHQNLIQKTESQQIQIEKLTKMVERMSKYKMVLK